ncbi:hypothetical protein ACHAXT_002400 [Thalassiosira profunda]
MNDKRSIEHLNEFSLFAFLEEQRNQKLRELYHGGGGAVGSSDTKGRNNPRANVDLPRWPPRYQCLDLLAERIASEMNSRRWRAVRPDTQREQEWGELDMATKTFLEDAVIVLRREYSESSSVATTRCSTPPCIPTCSPTTITPPGSPLRDTCTRHQTTRTREVDITDEEIMMMWHVTEPCDL